MVRNGQSEPPHGRPRQPQIDARRPSSSGSRPCPGSSACARPRAGADAYLVGGAVRDLLLGRRARRPRRGGGGRAPRRSPSGSAADARLRTAASGPRRAAVDGTRGRPGRHPARDLRAAGRASRGRVGVDRRRPRSAGLHRQRDGGSARRGAADLLDPHGGLADLEAASCACCTTRSFVDDPTRALRAAAIRGALRLRARRRTAELLRAADLETVSAERVEAELRRLAAEEAARRGFELLCRLGPR